MQANTPTDSRCGSNEDPPLPPATRTGRGYFLELTVAKESESSLPPSGKASWWNQGKASGVPRQEAVAMEKLEAG